MSDWKKTQENTFKKWVNNTLKGHLTNGRSKVNDFETDLTDGIVLAELLESLTKEKFRHVKDPKQLRIIPQRVENIGASFKFMDKKGVYLVNIGKKNIYSARMHTCTSNLNYYYFLLRNYLLNASI